MWTSRSGKLSLFRRLGERWLVDRPHGDDASFPFLNVDSLDEEPQRQYQHSYRSRQQQEIRRVRWRQYQSEVLEDEPHAGDAEQHAEEAWQVSRAVDEVAANQRGRSVEDHQQSGAVTIDTDEKVDERIELVSRKGLQKDGVLEQHWPAEEQHLADREMRGRDQPKERGEQGEVPVYGLQQDVEHEGQGGVAQSL